MKQFLSFVRKEFYHILRDKRTMLILLGMPVVQIILFGFAISTEVKEARVAVSDYSKDAVTLQIIERFAASEYFSIAYYLHSQDESDKLLKEGSVDMVMIFGDRFSSDVLRPGEASVQLILDATDPNQAALLTNYATGIFSSLAQEQVNRNNFGFQIIPQVRMLYNPQAKAAYNFVPGVMGLILMLICAMMTSIAIVREKETGSMEILLVSPVKPLDIILTKAVPYFTLSVVNLITILLLSFFVLNVPVKGSIFLIAGISFLFIFVALLFGLLISNVVNTQIAAMLISGMGLMMPTVLLSGMIFPIESMPAVLQWVADIIPARWYIQAMRKLMIQGVEGIYVLKEAIILVVMALFLILINFRRFKIRF